MIIKTSSNKLPMKLVWKYHRWKLRDTPYEGAFVRPSNIDGFSTCFYWSSLFLIRIMRTSLVVAEQTELWTILDPVPTSDSWKSRFLLIWSLMQQHALYMEFLIVRYVYQTIIWSGELLPERGANFKDQAILRVLYWFLARTLTWKKCNTGMLLLWF